MSHIDLQLDKYPMKLPSISLSLPRVKIIRRFAAMVTVAIVNDNIVDLTPQTSPHPIPTLQHLQ